MVNNFIGGGQVFLHKVRMFSQVFLRTLYVSMIVGIFFASWLNLKSLQGLDWEGFISYRKAAIARSWDSAMDEIRPSSSSAGVTYITARSGGRVWDNVDPARVQSMAIFKNADKSVLHQLGIVLTLALLIGVLCFISIFAVWSRFGQSLRREKRKGGSSKLLSGKEVKKKLQANGLASQFKIGGVPLVKDSETRHFLVTGSTGSGKTNLFHNILPNVERVGQSAVVIDQTGEMIAKYYDLARGDIVFNPFDARGSSWDFWADCSNDEDLERFSKILFGFNRKQSGSHSDPFWEQSAEVVFRACANYLRSQNNLDTVELEQMVRCSSLKKLQTCLSGTEAARYLTNDGKSTASSILSVLATNSKPLQYLNDSSSSENKFSLKEHFNNVKVGSKSWLFLATKPSSRELTLPLVSCLSELALSRLMDIGIDRERRVWFVIDELASLGKLPALSPLMAEGRKYGASVIAGLQSLNQLYENYGHYSGQTIFGQFGTSFYFRNNEPTIAKMVSAMCGSETIIKHQKNTSFGANSFRDGVSYNEQEKTKNLVDYSDLANLAVGECYMLLPEPEVRLSKIQTPEAKLPNKNAGFVQLATPELNKKQFIENVPDISENSSNSTQENSRESAFGELANDLDEEYRYE